MPDLLTDPANAPLVDLLDTYGHLPFHAVEKRHDGSILLALKTCGDYRAACALASKKAPDGGRLLRRGVGRVYDHLAGDLVFEHHCFPHLDCWEGR